MLWLTVVVAHAGVFDRVCAGCRPPPPPVSPLPHICWPVPDDIEPFYPREPAPTLAMAPHMPIRRDFAPELRRSVWLFAPAWE